MTAAVKRAILATLDRIRAERGLDRAREEYETRLRIERVARAAVPESESFAYDTGLSIAAEEAGVFK